MVLTTEKERPVVVFEGLRYRRQHQLITTGEWSWLCMYDRRKNFSPNFLKNIKKH